MNREFLINAVFLVLVNLLIKPFYLFGIERTIQDRVGAEVYGVYATLFSFSFLFFMVNDFGIHYFNNRTIAQHPQLAKKYIPNILVLKGILALAYIGLVFVGAMVRGFGAEVYYLLFFVALNHILVSMVAYLRSNISGLGLYRTDSVISTLDKVFLIAICAVLLWGRPFAEGDPFKIKWFVHAQNVSWVLTALLAFFIIFKKIKLRLRWRPNWLFLAVILKKTFPYALAVFLMTAYTRIDIVLLEWLLPRGAYHAGVYAAAYRLLDAFILIGYMFAGLLLPMFSKLLAAPRQPGAGLVALLRLSLHLILAGTLTLALSAFFYKNEIMALLYPLSVNAENEAYYGQTMGYLLLTLVPYSGVFIVSTLLTANDSLHKMNRLFVPGIVVNVGLNLLLIPRLQATGAALAAFFTQAIMLLSLTSLAKKELRLPFRFATLLRLIGFAAAVAVANWWLATAPPWPWYIKFATGLAAGTLLASTFRMIQLR